MIESSAPNIPLLAFQSALTFSKLLLNRQLHRRQELVGTTYSIEGAGDFTVFRNTVSDTETQEEPVVLVVGFALKGIHSSSIGHWLFQRVCLLTTPFWSGLPGFKVKLWMVDAQTKRYLGIYDWRGELHARRYVEALVRVLTPLSTENSVWFRLMPGNSLEEYLNVRRLALSPCPSS
ncbi:MAG: hypothetical protein AB7V46_11630 [Thermomicrobiales bacterium]